MEMGEGYYAMTMILLKLVMSPEGNSYDDYFIVSYNYEVNESELASPIPFNVNGSNIFEN